MHTHFSTLYYGISIRDPVDWLISVPAVADDWLSAVSNDGGLQSLQSSQVRWLSLARCNKLGLLAYPSGMHLYILDFVVIGI